VLVAKHLNVVMKVQPGKEKEFTSQGYDIYEDGVLVRYADNKKIHISEYLAVEAELEKARAELKALRGLIETQAKKKRAPAKKPAKK